MALVTVFNGIIFIEGDHPRAIKRFRADTSLDGLGSQLKNLDELKSNMAKIAAANGCNCVVNFAYGQKSKFWNYDGVVLVGTGFYGVLSPEDYHSIVTHFR